MADLYPESWKWTDEDDEEDCEKVLLHLDGLMIVKLTHCSVTI